MPPTVTFIVPLHAKFNATDKGDPVIKILVICFARKNDDGLSHGIDRAIKTM